IQMVDVNVNAPAEQAPAMALPTRTDDQIMSRNRWVAVGKSNCYLDVERSQSNPIYKITVDILKQTNFFRAFIASSTIPSIYIQHRGEHSQQSLICALRERLQGLETKAPIRLLQILWGVVNRAHIDYAERMWEEFTQSIHTFIDEKNKLAQHTQGNKKAIIIVIPSVSAKGTKREVFGMPIPNDLITDDIRGKQYYNAYLEKVAKHQRYLAGEEVSDLDSPAPKLDKPNKHKATNKSKPSAPKPHEKKRKMVMEISEAPSPAKRSKAGKLNDKRAIEDKFKGVPMRIGFHILLCVREPDSGNFNRVQSESESDEEVSGIVASVQNEGQAGPNPDEHDEGQAGPNLGDAATSQPPSSHVENLKLPTEGEVRLEEPASSAGTLSSLQHLDKELSFADQFLVEKSQEDEPEKTNTKSKVQSMVIVPIHQDTSYVPLMTTPVIDLTVSQPVPTAAQAPLP
ncbi:hypothetical protein Tco_0331198, partial [Tanacetum coccineum]